MSHTGIVEVPAVLPVANAAAEDAPDSDGARWSWAGTALFLALGLTVWPQGVAAAVMLTDLQILHRLVERHAPESFVLQIRYLYLTLLLIGALEGLALLHWVVLAALVLRVVTGECVFCRLLSRAPWNRERRL